MDGAVKVMNDPHLVTDCRPEVPISENVRRDQQQRGDRSAVFPFEILIVVLPLGRKRASRVMRAQMFEVRFS